MKNALLALGLLLPLLAGCGGNNSRLVTNDEYGDWQGGRVRNRPQGASAGLVIFGVDKDREAREAAANAGGGLSVNAYLWRATLDTLSFMPLASADPFGGVIITDWYTPAEAPDERLKVNIVILGRQLRADGVRASVFRQTRDGSGAWVDATVAPETATELENAILTRARELRIASADS
jgi:hypothetical protein